MVSEIGGGSFFFREYYYLGPLLGVPYLCMVVVDNMPECHSGCELLVLLVAGAGLPLLLSSLLHARVLSKMVHRQPT